MQDKVLRRHGAIMADLSEGLGASPLLRAMSQAGRARLLAAGAPHNVERGAQIMARGEPGECICIIVSGEAEVRVLTADGRESQIATRGKGAVLGEFAVLDGGPRSADVVALRRTRLLRISRAAVLNALREEPDAAIALLQMLSGKVRDASADLEAAVLLDLGGRLSRFLLAETASGARVTLPQAEIARRIDASREKVNRKLAQWRSEGFVEITRAGLGVIDRAALARLSIPA